MRGLVSATYALARSRNVPAAAFPVWAPDAGEAPDEAGAPDEAVAPMGVAAAPGRRSRSRPEPPGPVVTPGSTATARAAYQATSVAAAYSPQIAAPSARWSDTAHAASVVQICIAPTMTCTP